MYIIQNNVSILFIYFKKKQYLEIKINYERRKKLIEFFYFYFYFMKETYSLIIYLLLMMITVYTFSYYRLLNYNII